MIQLPPPRQKQRHLPLRLGLGSMHRDPLHPRRRRGRRLERRKDILANLPAGTMAHVANVRGGFGCAVEVDADLEAGGA
jgi:hypothetical protein